MVERVTQRMMTDMMQGDLRQAYQGFYDAQQRASTGKKVIDPSDDPAAKQQVLRIDAQISQMGSYDKNVGRARNQLGAVESAFQEMSDLLTRGRELAVQAANGSNSSSDRQAIRQEAEQILKQVGQLTNQQVDGEYIFSGTSRNRPAVNINQESNGVYTFDYNGNAEAKEYQVQEGERIALDFTAKDSDSAFRSALNAMSSLVQGFNNDQFTHLVAGNAASDKTVPMADSGSGLPAEEFNDTDGNGTPEKGQFQLQLADPAGNTKSISVEVDPADTDNDSDSDSLNDLQKNINEALGDPDTAAPASVPQIDGVDAYKKFTASIDAAGRLDIQAQDGYTFNIQQDDTNLAGVLGLDQDVPQLQAAIEDMGQANQAIADEQGRLGGKLNRLDMVQNQREDMKVDLKTVQSNLEDADIVKAYSDLTQRRQTLQGAMQSSTMLQQTTILNYI